MALNPDELAAMPEPVRRRFLRVYRVVSIGLFLILAGITVAALVPGRVRLFALIGIAVGAVLTGGAFLYAFKAGYRLAPPPIQPPSGDGAAPPESPER